jgi:dTDP-4-amino-4,6-dideoxygalactose transaminase
MSYDFIVFGQPLIENDEIEEVADSLRNAWLGSGPKVAQFEEDFANYKNAPYATALNSCTAGLHLSCLALELKPGDEIITTAMTFCATVNAIIHSGATPVLADIDPLTWNIDPTDIERKITSKTKAIVPVHFAGRACNMDAILQIVKKHNLHLIEDCAHAIETEYKGKKMGTFGDFGVFSFYATKNVVTGEGGMVISKHEEHISRIKMLALHGMSKDAWKRFSDEGYKHYYVHEAGYKYNMMDIQAAIGIHQLKRVEDNAKRREYIWNLYMDEFRQLPVNLSAAIEENTRHAYHLFIMQIDEKKCGISRDDFLTEMTKRKIGVGVHYLAIPEHPFYQNTYNWRPEDYPHATKFGHQTVSIPLTAKLTDGELERIIKSVKEVINGK